MSTYRDPLYRDVRTTPDGRSVIVVGSDAFLVTMPQHEQHVTIMTMGSLQIFDCGSPAERAQSHTLTARQWAVSDEGRETWMEVWAADNATEEAVSCAASMLLALSEDVRTQGGRLRGRLHQD